MKYTLILLTSLCTLCVPILGSDEASVSFPSIRTSETDSDEEARLQFVLIHGTVIDVEEKLSLRTGSESDVEDPQISPESDDKENLPPRFRWKSDNKERLLPRAESESDNREILLPLVLSIRESVSDDGEEVDLHSEPIYGDEGVSVMYQVVAVGEDHYIKRVAIDVKNVSISNACVVLIAKSSEPYEKLWYEIVFRGKDVDEKFAKKVLRMTSKMMGDRPASGTLCVYDYKSHPDDIHGPCIRAAFNLLNVDTNYPEFPKQQPIDVKLFADQRKHEVNAFKYSSDTGLTAISEHVPLDTEILDENKNGYVVVHDKNSNIPSIFIWRGPEAEKRKLQGVITEVEKLWFDAHQEGCSFQPIKNMSESTFLLYFKMNENEIFAV